MVSLPYGFTLFSNKGIRENESLVVSLPYGFTLFSNIGKDIISEVGRFTTLWIYTILKLLTRAADSRFCFTTLWIYTILKRKNDQFPSFLVSLPYGFTLFSNLK